MRRRTPTFLQTNVLFLGFLARCVSHPESKHTSHTCLFNHSPSGSDQKWKTASMMEFIRISHSHMVPELTGLQWHTVWFGGTSFCFSSGQWAQALWLRKTVMDSASDDLTFTVLTQQRDPNTRKANKCSAHVGTQAQTITILLNYYY